MVGQHHSIYVDGSHVETPIVMIKTLKQSLNSTYHDPSGNTQQPPKGIQACS